MFGKGYIKGLAGNVIFLAVSSSYLDIYVLFLTCITFYIHTQKLKNPDVFSTLTYEKHAVWYREKQFSWLEHHCPLANQASLSHL